MLATALVSLLLLQAPAAPPSAPARPPRPEAGPRPAPSPQPRPSGTRVTVPPQLVTVDDGDTIQIRWPSGDLEIVRLLGIDTPETRHVEHDIPFDQPFGIEAQGFARGAFAAATQIELLRAKTLDPYGRTLGYAFVNGVNYSLLVISGAPGRRKRDPLRRQRLPQGSRRGPGRRPGGGPATVRAPGRLPRADARGDEGHESPGRVPAH